MTYEIWGKYFNGQWELIDATESKRDCDYLINEYSVAFGIGWSFKVERKRD